MPTLPPQDDDARFHTAKQAQEAPPRLRLLGITKTYPGVIANHNINLTVQPGEIHAILGENGAGKSTLMKIIYGAVIPDAGSLEFDGRTVAVNSPQAAAELGIAMVFQHFQLFESLTVSENIWLGQSWKMSRESLEEQLLRTEQEFSLGIDPRRPVHTLSVGECQKVEILRSLVANPKLLILDEPTSVLTPAAVEKLFGVLRRLAASGCSILYISHKLHEIHALCDSCTVIRHGQVQGVVNPREQSDASLARLMIGAAPAPLQRSERKTGATVLQVNALNLPKAHMYGVDLQDIALQLRSGEIVGIAGISGNGQNELLQVLSGEDRRASADAVTVMEQQVGHWSPRRRRRLGLHTVPEERLGRATVPGMSLALNLLLTRTLASGPLGWLSPAGLKAHARRIIATYNVKAAGPQAAAKSLSGGNLQKFIVGREIDADPKILILAQPTWGVDVGAAAQIRNQILQLAAGGAAVLVISEELDELFEICDRLHVISKGLLSPSLPREQASIEKIGRWMSGLWNESGALPPHGPRIAEL